MAKTKGAQTVKNRWSEADRQAFAGGARLRASQIPNKRREQSRNACRRGSRNFE